MSTFGPEKSAATFAAENQVVPFGEIWVEQDTGYAKRGDGRAWSSMPYWSPIPGYADVPNVGEVSFPRALVTTGTAVYTSGTLHLAYFTARKSETIGTLTLYTSGTAAATITLIRYSVYAVAPNDDLTLMASTANDTSLLIAANTAYPKALSSAWSKQAGQRYAIGQLVVATTPPTMLNMQNATSIPAAIYGRSPRLCGAVTGLSDLPSTVAYTSVVDTVRCPYVLMTP